MISMRDKARRDKTHAKGCRSTSIVRDEDTDDTRSNCIPVAQLWVGSNRNWSVFLRRH